MKKLLTAVALTAVLALQSQALPINSPVLGGTVSPVPPSPLVAPAIIAQALGVPFTGVNVFGQPVFSGQLNSWVLQEAAGANPNGGLTFAWEFMNSSQAPADIARFTVSGWTGFGAIAGDNGMGVWPGVINPVSADRTATGSTIGFDFAGVHNGQDTTIFYLRSDAPSFGIASASLIDGGTANVATFAPKGMVPDAGATMGLLGLGLVALEGLRRRLGK